MDRKLTNNEIFSNLCDQNEALKAQKEELIEML